MALNEFAINPDWDRIFNDSTFLTIESGNTEIQCQLLFSLLLHFKQLSLRQFLCFVFDSKLPAVRMRAGSLMSAKGNRRESFLPPTLFELWKQNFPSCQSSLDQLIILPRAKEIVLAESNKIIADKSLSMASTQCSTDHIFDALKPGRFAGLYSSLAPFTWDLLLTFTTSPNRHRKYNLTRTQSYTDKDDNFFEDDWLGEDELEAPGPEQFYGETGTEWFKQGFIRNPTFVSCTAIHYSKFGILMT
jgi:hypothetical protein